jgi:hypothetical protein
MTSPLIDSIFFLQFTGAPAGNTSTHFPAPDKEKVRQYQTSYIKLGSRAFFIDFTLKKVFV